MKTCIFVYVYSLLYIIKLKKEHIQTFILDDRKKENKQSNSINNVVEENNKKGELFGGLL